MKDSFKVKGKKIPKNAHTIFSFRLPYTIPIPDGVYKVRVGKHTAVISLIRVQKDEVEGWQMEGGFIQFPYDKYGRSSFSSITMEFPWILDLSEEGRKPLLLVRVSPRSKAKEIVLRFLNRFIETVRFVTEEYWVEPARYQDILSFEAFYWDGKERYPAARYMLDTGIGGIAFGTEHPFKVEAEKIGELRNILENELELDVSKIFLLNSKDACLQEDFRLAVIEAVVALETVLYRFIRMQGVKLGIPEKKLKKFIKDVGLTGNVSIVLKMLTKGLEQIDAEIIEKCKGAITIRNNILHGGFMEVSSTDTEERIIAIEKMIAYLRRLIAMI